MRALGCAAKKQDTLHKACAAVGVPVPAALPAEGGQCFELHSVHGVLDCDFPHLGGKALAKNTGRRITISSSYSAGDQYKC